MVYNFSYMSYLYMLNYFSTYGHKGQVLRDEDGYWEDENCWLGLVISVDCWLGLVI